MDETGTVARLRGFEARRHLCPTRCRTTTTPASNLSSNKSLSRNDCEAQANCRPLKLLVRYWRLPLWIDTEGFRMTGDYIHFLPTRDTCLDDKCSSLPSSHTVWPCRDRLVTKHLDHQRSNARVCWTNPAGRFAENVLCPSVDGGSPPNKMQLIRRLELR